MHINKKRLHSYSYNFLLFAKKIVPEHLDAFFRDITNKNVHRTRNTY